MFLPKKTQVWNRDYPSLVTINRRAKDRSPNGLGDEFPDLWFDNLVQAQAIRASFLLESNAGFDLYALLILLIGWRTTRLSIVLFLVCWSVDCSSPNKGKDRWPVKGPPSILLL
jgi:hypothetical protein